MAALQFLQRFCRVVITKYNASDCKSTAEDGSVLSDYSLDSRQAMNELAELNPLQPHDIWMKRALDQAVIAYDHGEVPVGAIIVQSGRIIAEAYNQRETLNDPTAHAEMIAITQAAENLGSWRLLDCTLYVTLEPCPMCAGAIVQSRIPCVIYGATDPKGGACDTLFNITSDIRLNHQATVLGGVMKEDCGAILTQFFREQRALGKK